MDEHADDVLPFVKDNRIAEGNYRPCLTEALSAEIHVDLGVQEVEVERTKGPLAAMKQIWKRVASFGRIHTYSSKAKLVQ